MFPCEKKWNFQMRLVETQLVAEFVLKVQIRLMMDQKSQLHKACTYHPNPMLRAERTEMTTAYSDADECLASSC